MLNNVKRYTLLLHLIVFRTNFATSTNKWNTKVADSQQSYQVSFQKQS